MTGYKMLVDDSFEINSPLIVDSNGYAKKYNGDRTYTHLHRLILGITDSNILVDHIDGNRLNNQKSNLRICNRAENSKNRKSSKSSLSKYLGVSKESNRDSWRASIKCDGVSHHLGSFKTELEAAKAYDNAAKIHHKEFANLNFK